MKRKLTKINTSPLLGTNQYSCNIGKLGDDPCKVLFLTERHLSQDRPLLHCHTNTNFILYYNKKCCSPNLFTFNNLLYNWTRRRISYCSLPYKLIVNQKDNLSEWQCSPEQMSICNQRSFWDYKVMISPFFYWLIIIVISLPLTSNSIFKVFQYTCI